MDECMTCVMRAMDRYGSGEGSQIQLTLSVDIPILHSSLIYPNESYFSVLSFTNLDVIITIREGSLREYNCFWLLSL